MSAEVVRNSKGQFQKGHPGLKPKGMFSRVSNEIRDELSTFLQAKAKELPEIWQKLSPKEKARLFVEVAAFVVPKQKDISITAMSEPTKDAVARIFDFTDEEETTLWVEQTQKNAFPEAP